MFEARSFLGREALDRDVEWGVGDVSFSEPGTALMLHRSNSQATFGSLEGLLSPKKRAYLEARHGSGAFRRKALPVLLRNEPVFAPRFCAATVPSPSSMPAPSKRFEIGWRLRDGRATSARKTQAERVAMPC